VRKVCDGSPLPASGEWRCEVSPLGPIRLRYEVELAYQVNSDGADFIFNVQAAQTAQQPVFEESLFISQDIACASIRIR